MYETRPNPVADAEFYNIGGLPSAGNIIEFLPEKGGFLVHFRMTLRSEKGIAKVNRGGTALPDPTPLNPPLS